MQHANECFIYRILKKNTELPVFFSKKKVKSTIKYNLFNNALKIINL